MNAQLLQAAQLVWSPSLRVIRADGDCSTVLRRSARELVDAPCTWCSEPPRSGPASWTPAPARTAGAVEFISARVGTEEPSPLRLVLGLEAGEATAAIQDLDGLLDGAPPVQISKLSSSLSHEIRNPLSAP